MLCDPDYVSEKSSSAKESTLSSSQLTEDQGTTQHNSSSPDEDDDYDDDDDDDYDDDDDDDDEEEEDPYAKYDDHPLAQSLLRFKEKRVSSLKKEGENQLLYPKSFDGWWQTIYIVEGRALDLMALPFVLSVGHAVIYTFIQEQVLHLETADYEMWDIFFALVLNTTLASLLVYRLGRAQDHFWDARTYWGRMLARGRSFVGVLFTYSDHNVEHRDMTIRWFGALFLAVMELLRGVQRYPLDHFAGVLPLEEVQKLEDSPHPPLYAAQKIRYHLRQVFEVTENTHPSVAHARTRHLDSLEDHIDDILDQVGALQRIRSTPMPMVCVSHLRTMLMVCIFLMPYIYGPSWNWRTIPIVAVTAFSWFGTEAAAAEIEYPFREDRVNALNMDGFCIGFLQNMQQQVVCYADREIERKKEQSTARTPGNGSSRLPSTRTSSKRKRRTA